MKINLKKKIDHDEIIRVREDHRVVNSFERNR